MKHRCPKCKSFVPRQFHFDGGNCRRCGTRVGPPEWFTWGMANRPLGNGAEPMMPWDALVEVRPWELDRLGLATLLHFHMGLELPEDLGKLYCAPYADWPEHGPLDVTPENALSCSGMMGVDMLHNALLIICGSVASATHVARENAVMAANLCYYLGTRLCVGGAHQREQEIEGELRARDYKFLQDAIFFVFRELDLAHTASVEYVVREHPYI